MTNNKKFALSTEFKLSKEVQLDVTKVFCLLWPKTNVKLLVYYYVHYYYNYKITMYISRLS